MAENESIKAPSIVDYKMLGERIKNKRLNLGLSQEKVSEKLDISESFYSRIERGERILSVESLIKIAIFYDLSVDYLLLDSTNTNLQDKLQTELHNIFNNKTPSQVKYILDLLTVISENMDKLSH